MKLRGGAEGCPTVVVGVLDTEAIAMSVASARRVQTCR